MQRCKGGTPGGAEKNGNKILTQDKFKTGDYFFILANCAKVVLLNWDHCVSPIKSHSKQLF